MKKYTEQELKEIFANRFDCYADTEDDSVVMAMSEERYLDVLRELKILPIQHVNGSALNENHYCSYCGKSGCNGNCY